LFVAFFLDFLLDVPRGVILRELARDLMFLGVMLLFVNHMSCAGRLSESLKLEDASHLFRQVGFITMALHRLLQDLIKFPFLERLRNALLHVKSRRLPLTLFHLVEGQVAVKGLNARIFVQAEWCVL